MRDFRRGQAAIYDGIMFLLLAATAITFVFYILSGYGVAEDNTMRSAYQLAYIQDAGKAIFFINAKGLAHTVDSPATVAEANWVDPDAGVAPSAAAPWLGRPYYDLQKTGVYPGCAVLDNYALSTVSDLLKKDLGDYTNPKSGCATAVSPPDPQGHTFTMYTAGCVCFDNYYGRVSGASSQCAWRNAGSVPDPKALSKVPYVPGKLALQCAMMQVMKPFQQSGFKYFAYPLITETNQPAQQPPFSSSDPDSWRVTNHWAADANSWTDCQGAINAGYGVMTIAIPFRVPDNDSVTVDDNSAYTACKSIPVSSDPNSQYVHNNCAQHQSPYSLAVQDMEIRVCIWPSNATSNPR